MQSNCLGDKILCRVALGLEVSTLDSHLNFDLVPSTSCEAGKAANLVSGLPSIFSPSKRNGKGSEASSCGVQAVVRLLSVRGSLSPKRRRYDQGEEG